MAAFVVRARSRDDSGWTPWFKPSPTFSDVPAVYLFQDEVERLYLEQVTDGCAPSAFCPNNVITRGQMAVFLVRAFPTQWQVPAVTISPSSSTIDIGGTIHFTATVSDANGNPSTAIPSWTVFGGIGTVAPPTGQATTFSATATGHGSVRATALGVIGGSSIVVATVTNVTELNSTENEFGTALSSNGLTLYLETVRTGRSQIFLTTRTSTASPFGIPSIVPELASSQSVGQMTLAADGLEIFYTSGGGNLSLFNATRGGMSQPFGNIAAVGELNQPPYNTAAPSITADGLTLFFCSDRPGGLGGGDIYVATRPARGVPFGTPRLVSELNSSSYDCSPNISRDGLTIFFSSNRPGGLGDFDVCYAQRPTSAAPFGTPRNLTAVNSTVGDSWPHLGPDGRTLYWSSARPGGVGRSDVWRGGISGVLSSVGAQPTSR